MRFKQGLGCKRIQGLGLKRVQGLQGFRVQVSRFRGSGIGVCFDVGLVVWGARSVEASWQDLETCQAVVLLDPVLSNPP